MSYYLVSGESLTYLNFYILHGTIGVKKLFMLIHLYIGFNNDGSFV